MAENTKHKITYLIIGISIGLIIGAWISFSQNYTNLKSCFPLYYFLDEEPLDSAITELTEPEVGTPKRKKKKNSLKDTDNNIVMIDSIDIDSNNLVLDSNTIIIDSTLDSIPDTNADIKILDTLIYTKLNINEADANDIHLAKDAIIYALYVIPQGERNDFQCNTNEKRDSLLTNNTKSKQKNGLYVEFWQSPINYSGYKLGRNTLVLFGFYEYADIRLAYIPNGLLRIQYHEYTFDLECTDTFIPLDIKTPKKPGK